MRQWYPTSLFTCWPVIQIRKSTGMLCLHTFTGVNLVEQSTIYHHKCKPHIYDIRGTSTWDITGSLKKLCSVHSTVSSIHWITLKFKLSNTYWDKMLERPCSRIVLPFANHSASNEWRGTNLLKWRRICWCQKWSKIKTLPLQFKAGHWLDASNLFV